jgi:hypothetical protein
LSTIRSILKYSLDGKLIREVKWNYDQLDLNYSSKDLTIVLKTYPSNFSTSRVAIVKFDSLFEGLK